MNERQRESNQHQPQEDTEHSAEAEPNPSPAIYVASLADYNNGVLHGTWLDAARDPEVIHADIDAMLARSRDPGAEEWAIHDFEQFGSWKVHEHDSIERVSRIARNIAEHGYAYAAWVDVFDGEEASLDTDSFSEAYLGHFDSVQDYVEHMADDLGYEQELAKLPEYLQAYTRIDYAALARDLELSGEVAAVRDPTGGVWLFRTDAS